MICPSYCLQCNNLYCNRGCIGGTYPIIETQQCFYCDYGCESCTRFGCDTCMSGYSLNLQNICKLRCNDYCLNCDQNKNCISCVAGYSLGTTIPTCYLCSENCIDCNESGCTTCNTSYILDSNAQKCIATYIYKCTNIQQGIC